MKRSPSAALFIAIIAALPLTGGAFATDASAPMTWEGEGTIYCEVRYLHAGGTCPFSPMPSTIDFELERPAVVTVTFRWDAVSDDASDLMAYIAIGNCTGTHTNCPEPVVGGSPLTITAQALDGHELRGQARLTVPRSCSFGELPNLDGEQCDDAVAIVVDQTFTYEVLVEPIS